MINKSGEVSISVKSLKITNSLKQLGKQFDNNLCFDSYASRLCMKALQKVSALSWVATYMDIDQRKVVMKALISSQFGYCPLV